MTLVLSETVPVELLTVTVAAPGATAAMSPRLLRMTTAELLLDHLNTGLIID